MARTRARSTPDPAYLLAVKPGSERAVWSRLREIGVRSYVPRFLEYPPSGPVEIVLFASYVFVYPGDQWREIGRIKSVFGFVTFGDNPARVPDRVISGLKALEGPTGYIRMRPRNVFRKGQKVRIGDKGNEVTVSDILGPGRVEVLLSMLGREIKMPVSEGDLVAA